MMEKPCSRWVLVGALVALPAPACVLAGPAAQEFTLGKYVPQDFCWFIHGVHNPKHDFIDAHWARVFDEVKKSGIDKEVKKLIVSNLCAADRAEFEQAWDTAVKLLHGVRWGDLIAKEMVFSERFGSIIPDYLILCRSSADSVEPNVRGLRAILDTLAPLSESIAVTESTVQGITVWSLAATDFPASLHVFAKDDVVGIVIGERALNDILGLMTGKKGVGAITDSPRFQKALAELPTPESSLMYFDFQMFMRDMNRTFETLFDKKAERSDGLDEDARRGTGIIRKLFDHFDFLDYTTMSCRTEGLREITVSKARLRADALDKPICRMLTTRKQFDRFDKYIPKEASGFSVSSLVDLQKLYEIILDFIRDEVPESEAGLAKWAQFQQEMGFDLQADLFSWWSGEYVSVNLPPAIKGPFASADFVLFVRVKDAELAAAKVNAGIDRLATLAREFEQPLMIADAGDVNAEGFRSLTHPLIAMQGLKFIVGVTDGQLVIGNSAAGINACLATAAGKAPGMAENERFKNEGLMPEGAVYAASFSDLSNLGQELGTIFFMMGMVGQFIPDAPDTKPAKAIISILGRLSPAIAQIDFLSSSASVVTFDGQVWTTKQVLNYKPAPPPKPKSQAPGGSANESTNVRPTAQLASGATR